MHCSSSKKRPREEDPSTSPASKVYIIKLEPNISYLSKSAEDNSVASESNDFANNCSPTIQSLNSDSAGEELMLPDINYNSQNTDSGDDEDYNNDEKFKDEFVDDESDSKDVTDPSEHSLSISQLNDEPESKLKEKKKKGKATSVNAPTQKDPSKLRGWDVNRGKLKFQHRWLKEFPFIDYDEENNVMFCRACRKYVNDWRRNSPFVVGNSNFRASMLRYHQRSSMHAECQELADTVASEGCDASDRDLYRENLEHVFKSVYFIFKNKMPYTHYPQLCNSQKSEGTEISVYSSHLKVVPLIGKFISMAIEKENGWKISNLNEFTLIIDASFRRNIESHDLVYLKYLDGFCVETVFLGVIDSSAKLHDSIYSILCDLFKKYGISDWINKVVFMMTDKSDCHMWLDGLISLIQSTSSSTAFTSVKYLSHKIKYCASVVQNHKTTSTFDALLWSIYCYYERVDKGKKNLAHMNKELDDIIECYGNLPKNSYTTLYYEALRAIERDYDGLVRLLESEQLLLHCDVKVRKAGARILSVITRSSFIYKLALFIDIFSCLNDFGIAISSDDTLPFDVPILIDEVCTDVEKAAKGEGPAYSELVAELSENPTIFRGVEVSEDSTLHHILPEARKFCKDVISYYRSLVDDDSFLEYCSIFNTCLWPEDEEIDRFGNSEFIYLFEKFNGGTIFSNFALAEWNIFKTKVLSLLSESDKQNSKNIILKIVSEHEHEFPYVIPVLKKTLLLNFEWSEIKRGYNEMCLNKSFSRSMLNLQSLQTSMLISMYGPPLSAFDCRPGLDLFLNSRNRKFRKKIIDRKLLVID